MSDTKQFRECNVIDWSFIYANDTFLYYIYDENKELSNQADIQTQIITRERENNIQLNIIIVILMIFDICYTVSYYNC